MNTCNISYKEEQRTFEIEWSPDLTPMISPLLNPDPVALLMRKMKVPDATLNSLTEYLGRSGVSVIKNADGAAAFARAELWGEKIWTDCGDLSDAQILDFLTEVGISFRPAQVDAIVSSFKKYFFILSGICGFGKTLVQLVLAQLRKKLSGNAFTVIVTPSSAAAEYSKDLSRFRGHFDLTLEDLSYGDVEENRIRFELATADIYVFSVDSIHRYTDLIISKLQKIPFEKTLSVDEGHYVKNLGRRRSTAVQKIAPHFDRVLVSTATPMPLGPKDIRGYLSLVTTPQPEELYSGGTIPKRDYELLKKVAFVADEADLSFSVVDKEKVIYGSLTELIDRIVPTSRNEISKGGKILMFCRTNNALTQLYSALGGIPRTVLSGSFAVEDFRRDSLVNLRSKADQQQAIKDFNENPDCKIMIANYRVGSTGLNLQYSGARMAIFFEITDNGADFFQSEYRIRRPFIFPTGGFQYLYAVPSEPVAKNRVERQFMKLANQRALLSDLKASVKEER